MSRILVVGSNPEDARKICELVSAQHDAEIVLADSADAAEHAIRTGQPALVLASAVMPPAVEARLMSAVRSLPASVPVTVLMLPPLVDVAEEPEPAPRGTLLSLFSRRTSKAKWQHYDAAALGQRIREALAQSIDEREWLTSREQLWAEAAASRVEPAFLKSVEPHERAPRFTSTEASWLSSVKLSWGLEVKVVNISRSGMLIESGTRFSEGGREEFELAGAASRVRAIARFVRSHVTEAEGFHVRYQTAAVFDGEIHLPLDAMRRRATDAADIEAPAALREVMSWVQEEAAQGMPPSQLLAAYELELQRLVRACEVRICDSPAISDDTGASVFFTVRGGAAVLRATFDHGHRPSRRALTLLKQAALLAPDVVQIEAAAVV